MALQQTNKKFKFTKHKVDLFDICTIYKYAKIPITYIKQKLV